MSHFPIILHRATLVPNPLATPPSHKLRSHISTRCLDSWSHDSPRAGSVRRPSPLSSLLVLGPTPTTPSTSARPTNDPSTSARPTTSFPPLSARSPYLGASHHLILPHTSSLWFAVFGRAFLNDAVSTHEAGKPAADQLPGMDGSVMILRFPTIEEAWARIKADKYWTGGVWDKDKVMVREIIGAPGVDETIKIQ